MAFDTSAALVREAVRRLGQAGLEPQEFLYEVSGRVQRVVPHDAAGWLTLDPDTLLPSGTLETSKSTELVRALWRVDGMEPARNSLAGLARRRSPVITRSMLDESFQAASPRVRLMHRVGLAGDDMRTMLRVGGHTWGVVALYRATGERAFDERERNFMADLSEEIGEGLRRGLARRPVAGTDELLPGVVVFGADGAITSVTGQARKLMNLASGDVDATLYAVAIRAAAQNGARARLRLADGRWLQLHGAPLVGETNDVIQTTVTLLPPTSVELTSMLLRLHGLTARERQVAELLMHGHATEEIAGQLHISRHTLRDHVKAIFTKVGATSRSQLMALITDYVTPARDVAHLATETGGARIEQVPWPQPPAPALDFGTADGEALAGAASS